MTKLTWTLSRTYWRSSPSVESDSTLVVCVCPSGILNWILVTLLVSTDGEDAVGVVGDAGRKEEFCLKNRCFFYNFWLILSYSDGRFEMWETNLEALHRMAKNGEIALDIKRRQKKWQNIDLLLLYRAAGLYYLKDYIYIHI